MYERKHAIPQNCEQKKLAHTNDTPAIILYIARNVVFDCLLVKENNAKFSCQLFVLFCGRFERSGVQGSCRAPNIPNALTFPQIKRCRWCL